MHIRESKQPNCCFSFSGHSISQLSLSSLSQLSPSALSLSDLLSGVGEDADGYTKRGYVMDVSLSAQFFAPEGIFSIFSPSVRNSRLFYVYTDKKTSTVLTTSLCYVTAGTAGTSCSGRRKRAVIQKQLGGYLDDVSSSAAE